MDALRLMFADNSITVSIMAKHLYFDPLCPNEFVQETVIQILLSKSHVSKVFFREAVSW